MGDVVMITPALRALLDAFDTAEFHLLTSVEGRRVLEGFDSRIRRTLVYDRKPLRGLVARRRIRSALERIPYTHAFVFESGVHYHDLLRDVADSVHLLGAREGPVHYARHCLDLVAAGTGRAVGDGWAELPVHEEGKRRAAALMRTAGIDDATVVVGLHPTSWLLTRARRFVHRRLLAHRVWPAESFAALASTIHRWAADHSMRLRLVVDVLPEERRFGEAIRDLSGGVVTLFSASPDFERYKGVLRRMDLLVTIDTGPMHIAAALDTPLVCLFSDKSPLDCGPYMPPERHAVLRSEDAATPERGMAAIAAADVFEACLPFLHAAAAARRD